MNVKFPKDTTILITGSAGFIGFHTSRKLLKQGVNVIGLDNFNDYYDNLLIDGSLQSVGTKSEPIYFTSIQDDCIGGDTNGDGTMEAQIAGDEAGVVAGGKISIGVEVSQQINVSTLHTNQAEPFGQNLSKPDTPAGRPIGELGSGRGYR